MLNLNAPLLLPRALLVRLLAVIAGGSFSLVLIAAMGKAAHFAPVAPGASQSVGTVNVLGKMLFNEFLLPFELTSVLFIATMVGVVVLTKKEE
jgi:NADH-quinone oxidoreductase subunit J